jgi:hypothetical protein
MRLTPLILGLFRRFTPCLIASLGVSCGSKVETVKVKNYRMALVERVLSFETEFMQLVRDFNQAARLNVLAYEKDLAQANSPIVVTKGLKAKTGGKIGLGQWIAQTDSSTSFALASQSSRQDTTYFSMRLEFDADYIQSRLGTGDPVKQFEKQKLFFHEVGHGLEMDHVKDPRDVMYEDVDGEKDFEAFFNRVRTYMQDRE